MRMQCLLLNCMNLFKGGLGQLASNFLIACLLIGCSNDGDSAKQSSEIKSQKPTQETPVIAEKDDPNKIAIRDNIDNARGVVPEKDDLNKIAQMDDIDDQTRVIATEPYRLEGIEVSLLDVKRASGDTLNVYWRMSNQSSVAQELVKCSASWYCKYQLAAGNWGDGIYIIDSANQRKHLVVRADKRPVVSTSITPLSIEPGSSINLWAKFPSPPLDVKKVSIYIPGVAPMEDIPISE